MRKGMLGARERAELDAAIRAYVAQGLTSVETARQLGISPRTVQRRRKMLGIEAPSRWAQ